MLAKVVLQVFVLLKQHSPVPFGTVPIGQVPVNVGVEHVPPDVVRLQVKCSAFESRQRLPPVMVEEAEAIRMLNETLAV